MTTRQSPINFPVPCGKRRSEQGRNRVADLESQAQLVEKLIPKFKSDHDRLWLLHTRHSLMRPLLHQLSTASQIASGRCKCVGTCIFSGNNPTE